MFVFFQKYDFIVCSQNNSIDFEWIRYVCLIVLKIFDIIIC